MRQLGNADLANCIRHRHALAAQNLNLPKLRDDLIGLVSLGCHRGPPSWSKPYFKVDPFNGGGSGAPVSGLSQYSRLLTQSSYCGARSVGASSRLPIEISASVSLSHPMRPPQVV